MTLFFFFPPPLVHLPQLIRTRKVNLEVSGKVLDISKAIQPTQSNIFMDASDSQSLSFWEIKDDCSQSLGCMRWRHN